jgi:hypothetical protein
MGTTQDHRKCAEDCVAMARLSQDDSDRVLWLTLAQSWVRLAEHVERSEPMLELVREAGEPTVELAPDEGEPALELVRDDGEDS